MARRGRAGCEVGERLLGTGKIPARPREATLSLDIDREGRAPQNTRLILRRGTQAANGGRL
jgi:hypothetical protein